MQASRSSSLVEDLLLGGPFSVQPEDQMDLPLHLPFRLSFHVSCRKLKCKRGRQLEAVLEGDDSAPCTSAFDEVLPCRKLAELVLPTARFSVNVALS